MKIDIPKSKEKMRVVRKGSYINSFIDNIYYFMIICIWPYIAVSEFIKSLRYSRVDIWAILFTILGVITGCFIFYRVLKINSLVTINGLNKALNRELVVAAANNLGWKIEYNNSNFIILSKGWGWASWDWGKEMTIVYDRNDLLINCVSYGSHRLKSPFHWIANRKTINKLTAELKRLHTHAETQL